MTLLWINVTDYPNRLMEWFASILQTPTASPGTDMQVQA